MHVLVWMSAGYSLMSCKKAFSRLQLYMILFGESPVFVPGKKKPRSESAPLKGNAQDKLEDRQEMERNVVRRSTGSGNTGVVFPQKSVSPVRRVGESSLCEFVGVYMCVYCTRNSCSYHFRHEK